LLSAKSLSGLGLTWLSNGRMKVEYRRLQGALAREERKKGLELEGVES
jgi:hypothetical protein